MSGTVDYTKDYSKQTKGDNYGTSFGTYARKKRKQEDDDYFDALEERLGSKDGNDVASEIDKQRQEKKKKEEEERKAAEQKAKDRITPKEYGSIWERIGDKFEANSQQDKAKRVRRGEAELYQDQQAIQDGYKKREYTDADRNETMSIKADLDRRLKNKEIDNQQYVKEFEERGMSDRVNYTQMPTKEDIERYKKKESDKIKELVKQRKAEGNPLKQEQIAAMYNTVLNIDEPAADWRRQFTPDAPRGTVAQIVAPAVGTVTKTIGNILPNAASLVGAGLDQAGVNSAGKALKRYGKEQSEGMDDFLRASIADPNARAGENSLIVNSSSAIGSLGSSLALATSGSTTLAANVFGLNAAGEMYRDTQEAGKSNLQGLLTAIPAGLAEAGLEKVGLEGFLKAGGSPLRRFITRSVIEGSQEITQSFAQSAISGTYKEDADTLKYWEDVIKQAATEGLYGAIAGGGGDIALETSQSLQAKGMPQDVADKVAARIKNLVQPESTEQAATEDVAPEITPEEYQKTLAEVGLPQDQQVNKTAEEEIGQALDDANIPDNTGQVVETGDIDGETDVVNGQTGAVDTGVDIETTIQKELDDAGVAKTEEVAPKKPGAVKPLKKSNNAKTEGNAKDYRVLTIKDGKTGSSRYVAEIGNAVKDRVGRQTGFKSSNTSQEFNSEAEAQKWISKQLENNLENKNLPDSIKVGSKDVYYHGTTAKDAESIIKNGWDTKLSSKGNDVESPNAISASTNTDVSYGDHSAGNYGDGTVLKIIPKQDANLLDGNSETWQKTIGQAKNRSELIEASKKLKDMGYDGVQERNGEVTIFNPDKFKFEKNNEVQSTQPKETETVEKPVKKGKVKKLSKTSEAKSFKPIEEYAQKEYGKPASKLSPTQIAKIMADKKVAIKGDRSIIQKMARWQAGYTLDESREALIYGGTLNGYYTDGYVLLSDKTAVKQMDSIIEDKFIKDYVKQARRNSGNDFNIREAEDAAKKALAGKRQDLKDQYPKIGSPDMANHLHLKDVSPITAEVMGYYTPKDTNLRYAVIKGAKTYVVLDANKLAFMEKMLPGHKLKITNNSLAPVQFVKNNKINGVIMPLKQDGSDIPDSLKAESKSDQLRITSSVPLTGKSEQLTLYEQPRDTQGRFARKTNIPSRPVVTVYDGRGKLEFYEPKTDAEFEYYKRVVDGKNAGKPDANGNIYHIKATALEKIYERGYSRVDTLPETNLFKKYPSKSSNSDAMVDFSQDMQQSTDADDIAIKKALENRPAELSKIENTKMDDQTRLETAKDKGQAGLYTAADANSRARLMAIMEKSRQALKETAQVDKEETGNLNKRMTFAKTADELAKLADDLNKAGQASAILRRGGLKSKKALGHFVHKAPGEFDHYLAMRDAVIKDPKLYPIVLAHELSHAIEYTVNGDTKSTYKIFGELSKDEIAQIDKELRAIVDNIETAEVAQTNPGYFYKPTEMLARYVETMMIEPMSVSELAPTVQKHFEKAIIAHPQIADLVNAIEGKIDTGKSKVWSVYRDLRQTYTRYLGKYVGNRAYDAEIVRRANVQRSATAIDKLIKEKFKSVKDSGEALFVAAEGILATQDGVVTFGTHDYAYVTESRDMMDEIKALKDAGYKEQGAIMKDGEPALRFSRVRYTAEQAKQNFEALSPEGQQLLKDFTETMKEAKDLFNRKAIADVYKIDQNIEGWVHRGLQVEETKGRMVLNKLGGRRDLRKKTAGMKRQRSALNDAYVKDFKAQMTKALMEGEFAKIDNAFIDKQLARISKPIAKGEKADKGWVEVTADLKQGLRLPGEGMRTKMNLEKIDDFTGEKTTAKFLTPEQRYQVPAELANHYRKVRLVQTEMTNTQKVLQNISKYWSMNILVSGSSLATNGISGGIQYAAKVMNDAYLDALTGDITAKQTRANLAAPLRVLTPKGWHNAASWIYGGMESTFAGQFMTGKDAGTIDKIGDKALALYGAVESYWKKVITTSEQNGQKGLPKIMTPQATAKGIAELSKAEADLIAKMNDAVDIFGYDYDNVALWIESWQRGGGTLVKPFIKYPYKYSKQVTHFVGGIVDKDLTWQERTARALTVGTMTTLSLLLTGMKAPETPEGDEKTPPSFDPRGRLFIGRSGDEEKFVRLAKYPFVNITTAAKAAYRKDWNTSWDIVKDQIGSIAPVATITAAAFGYKSEYDQYKSVDQIAAQNLASYIPGTRILQDISRITDPVSRKPDNAAQAFLQNMPVPGSEETKARFKGKRSTIDIPIEPESRTMGKKESYTRDRQLNKNDALISALTGVFIKRINVEDAKAFKLRNQRNKAEEQIRQLLLEGKISDAQELAEENGFVISKGTYDYYRNKRRKNK